MLFGQNFGGSHERGLMTTVDRHEHGLHCDEGLAGTDITLQQAMHRTRIGEVAFDLVEIRRH